MNVVCLVGRLTKAPVLELKGDKSRTEFVLAVSRNHDYKQADFIRCQAWGSNAEFCVRNFKKGQSIKVNGNIRTSQYEENGKKKYSTIVVADQVGFAGDKGGT